MRDLEQFPPEADGGSCVLQDAVDTTENTGRLPYIAIYGVGVIPLSGDHDGDKQPRPFISNFQLTHATLRWRFSDVIGVTSGSSRASVSRFGITLKTSTLKIVPSVFWRPLVPS